MLFFGQQQSTSPFCSSFTTPTGLTEFRVQSVWRESFCFQSIMPPLQTLLNDVKDLCSSPVSYVILSGAFLFYLYLALYIHRSDRNALMEPALKEGATITFSYGWKGVRLKVVPWSKRSSDPDMTTKGDQTAGGPLGREGDGRLHWYPFLFSTRSSALILIGSRLFLTAMAIHLSLRVAPLDLQQGGNSRILYVHVPAARMSILVYIAMAINTFLFLLTKHPLFLRSSGTGTEMGAFFTLFTLVTGGFRGRPMWGTFWVWDARLTSVFISFLIYLGALRFQKLPVEPALISICVGPIDIPIIKSSVNWWNTLHQPGSISRSGTSIHVPMPIPILSNFANFPLSTRILFVLETRFPILSFLESPLRDEIEAREGIAKPS
ncbi:hypothetical protein AHAS_Ahas14G0096000 [Arachis hypogaea]